MIFTTVFATTNLDNRYDLSPKPTDEKTLQTFFDRVKPGGPDGGGFWQAGEQTYSLLPGILFAAVSGAAIIALLFGMGEIFFGSMAVGLGCFAAGTGGLWFVVRKI
jgi:solute:Na+ symporter, SSS family